MNQEEITKLLVICEHLEIEYKCLFKGTSWLVSVYFGVLLFWKQPVSGDGRMNLHRWVRRCRPARESTCYLFVCLLMENKPGEIKCFAWKIDFSLPGNTFSVPHWPFDLLCLFEFAEVSHFILDPFRHGSTHYSQIFIPTVSHLNGKPQLHRSVMADPLPKWKTSINTPSRVCRLIPPSSARSRFRDDTGGLALFHDTFLFFSSHIYWGNSWQPPQDRPPSSREDLTGD